MMDKAFRRLTGFADVEQRGNQIIISGISANTISRDMKYIWNTSKIAASMFIKATWSEVRIPTFFALEFQYILKQLIKSKGLYTSKRILLNVIESLETNTWISRISDKQTPWLKREHLSEIIYDKLLPHQAEFIDVYENTVRRYNLRGMLLSAAPGAGKAQPLYSKVLTPSGWRLMGSLRVGDRVVTPDGSVAPITGVFPQGIKDIYEITFADGRKARACGEHLWSYFDGGPETDEAIIKTTLEIKARVDDNAAYIHHIPLLKKYEGHQHHLPNDPYKAGLMVMGGQYNHEDLSIPDIYMCASATQRLHLLQALMDSSGIVNHNSSASFSCHSQKLAEQVTYLVRSLGGIARIGREDSLYVVFIQYPKPTELFRLTQVNLDKCDDGNCLLGDSLRLGIKSIEYVGEEEAQCIMVDHPDHLYITDDFVVTHNTVTGCSIALATESTKVIIISPLNAIHKVWQKTLQKEFKIPQDPYIYKDSPNKLEPEKKWHIFHYEAIGSAIELAKSFRNEKVCIIIDECHNFNEIKSNRTARLLELGVVAKSENILWMSGTPVKALGFETIPLLKSIDPYFNDVAENAFRKMYGKDAKRTLDILAYRIGLISHTTPKELFMRDEPVNEILRVKMPDSEKYTLPELSKVMGVFIEERMKYYKDNRSRYQKIFDECIEIHRATIKNPQDMAVFKEYLATVNYLAKNGFDNKQDADKAVFTNKYEKDRIHPTLPQELRKPFADAKSVIKYVDLKVRGECLGRILTKERIQCHVDMLAVVPFKDIIDTVRKKTLIFTSYVNVVDAAMIELNKQGYRPLKVYGATNSELSRTIDQFTNDPKANPMVATFDSLSTAVPITCANAVIFLNNPWRSYIRDQALARAHRIGQTETVYSFDIVLDTGNVPNISSRSMDIMQWSKDQVDRIMGINGDVTVSIESNGFFTSQLGDPNEFLDDVLFDENHVLAGVSYPKLEEEKPFVGYSDQHRYYCKDVSVSLELGDEETIMPLNSIEAGSSQDPCELSPDWKQITPEKN